MHDQRVIDHYDRQHGSSDAVVLPCVLNELVLISEVRVTEGLRNALEGDMNQKIGLVFIAVLSFIFVNQPHAAELDDVSSLQCDGGIVTRGDSGDSVKEKCGEPQKILRPDPQEPVQWVYDLGSTQFIYYVSFVNGKVERIQLGPYGD